MPLGVIIHYSWNILLTNQISIHLLLNICFFKTIFLIILNFIDLKYYVITSYSNNLCSRTHVASVTSILCFVTMLVTYCQEFHEAHVTEEELRSVKLQMH